MVIHLLIELSPVSWKAPRVHKTGTYSPHTLDKEAAKWHVRQKYRGEPLTGPLKVNFKFFMPIPESTPKKLRAKMEASETYHVKKPDLTNLRKLAEDYLEGIVYKNDSQICCGYSEKVYSTRPRTLITIEEL